MAWFFALVEPAEVVKVLFAATGRKPASRLLPRRSSATSTSAATRRSTPPSASWCLPRKLYEKVLLEYGELLLSRWCRPRLRAGRHPHQDPRVGPADEATSNRARGDIPYVRSPRWPATATTAILRALVRLGMPAMSAMTAGSIYTCCWRGHRPCPGRMAPVDPQDRPRPPGDAGEGPRRGAACCGGVLLNVGIDGTGHEHGEAFLGVLGGHHPGEQVVGQLLQHRVVLVGGGEDDLAAGLHGERSVLADLLGRPRWPRRRLCPARPGG